MEGLLLVNKPLGVTSHDAVDVLRRRLKLRRIGHTGTLDPMAEGLLILLVGGATKRQQEFQRYDKVYEASLKLGVQTDTADAEGRVVRAAPVPPLESSQVQAVFTSLIGPHVQTPPAFSAVKVGGHPSYWWARRQRPMVLRPRTVHLFELRVIALEEPVIRFRISCSSGTYIRTLAETIADRLGTVGHLVQLTRIGIGRWNVEQALPLSWYAEQPADTVLNTLKPIPPVTAAHARRDVSA